MERGKKYYLACLQPEVLNLNLKKTANDPSSEDLAVDGPSGVGLVRSLFKVSPKDIPLPKQTMMNKRKQNRKRGKTPIITDSPHINELEEEIKSDSRKRADTKKQTQKNLFK